jgi:glycosyltransferase involved in cell wall biosynthesis
MRVLMLGWEFPPHVTGGLGVACAGLARALADWGAEVSFLVPSLHGDEDAGRVRLLDADAARGDAASLPSAYGPSRRPTGRSDRYGRDLMAHVERFAGAAEAAARAERPDVVHGHDWTAFPAAERAARAAKAAWVLHVHSTEHDRSGRAPHPGIVAIEQRGLDAADAVVCVSRYAAAVVSSRYGVDERKMHVVHNAVPPPPGASPRASPRRIPDPVVLFAGRVTAQKGPGAFLDAAKRVLSVEPRARFVVAGTGDLWAESIERAAALGIARGVHFTGFLSPGEIERAYGEADVYVMPSVSEPFGLAALEAAARGVPVVLSRQSGAIETLPSALRADFRDPVDLADKILACLRRPGLRREVIGRGREEALARDWRRQAGYVLSLYERLR